MVYSFIMKTIQLDNIYKVAIAKFLCFIQNKDERGAVS